uniref:Inhibitor of growth protein n=1 Tax=Lygus hesperus TaxID=30085 RepID=A0A146L453_LYGHE
MLYLEDYLEMIEHLPQELRDRFTEMRELDLQVQNTMDSLEKRVRFFFMNAKKMKQADKDMEYEAIRKNYYKTLEDADEKVQLANQMYDLVSRYLRRLDQESHKFKLELEADHIGITELLEKRSYDMDAPVINSSQKENRYSFPNQRVSHGEPPIKKRRDSSASIEPKRKLNTTGSVERVLPDLRMALSGHAGMIGPTPPAPPPAMTYTLGHHIGAGGTAIAAAASQAIAATQQMQQGRRTASLKASYEAIHGSGGGSGPGGPGGVAPELSISKELAGAAQTAIAAIQDTHKKNKKKSTVLSTGTPPIASPVSVPSPDPTLSTAIVERAESYDPNEPRYCICREVAFGTMVACDSKSCPYEWYHYPCVGITDKPKGKWYCPHCTAAMKRRNRKTN